MLDYITYLQAQKRMSEVAREALPDAPERPERSAGQILSARFNLRHRVSLALHRLAELVEPVAERGEPYRSTAADR